jgi:hypothetical protein
MDLKTKLKTRISKVEIDELIQNFDQSKLSLEEVISLLKNKQTQFQASWLLTHLVEKKPSILKEAHIKILGEIIENTSHEGLQRNIWRSLSFIEIPTPLHEALINLAFEKLENHRTAIAIQVFSMDVLEKLLINETELQLALKAILELKLERQPSPGLKSRATKIIGKINLRIHN